MLIDAHTAGYVRAAAEAIEGGDTADLTNLTDTCPDCRERITAFNTGVHVAVAATPITSAAYMIDDQVYVIVGCEGAWVIDPRQVGIVVHAWANLTDDVINAMNADEGLVTHRDLG
jgi:hypothetical protein